MIIWLLGYFPRYDADKDYDLAGYAGAENLLNENPELSEKMLQQENSFIGFSEKPLNR
jgi:hypothetical protein